VARCQGSGDSVAGRLQRAQATSTRATPAPPAPPPGRRTSRCPPPATATWPALTSTGARQEDRLRKRASRPARRPGTTTRPPPSPNPWPSLWPAGRGRSRGHCQQPAPSDHQAVVGWGVKARFLSGEERLEHLYLELRVGRGTQNSWPRRGGRPARAGHAQQAIPARRRETAAGASPGAPPARPGAVPEAPAPRRSSSRCPGHQHHVGHPRTSGAWRRDIARPGPRERDEDQERPRGNATISA